MQINISARHGDLSAATQEKISEKVAKLTRFFDRLTAIHVTVDLEHRETPSVEVRVSAELSDGFIATDSSNSVVAALDSAVRKIEQQLKKHKEKLKLTGRRSPGLKHYESPELGEPEAE